MALAEMYPDGLNIFENGKNDRWETEFTLKGLLHYISLMGSEANKTLVMAIQFFFTSNFLWTHTSYASS